MWLLLFIAKFKCSNLSLIGKKSSGLFSVLLHFSLSNLYNTFAKALKSISWACVCQHICYSNVFHVKPIKEAPFGVMPPTKFAEGLRHIESTQAIGEKQNRDK